MKTNCPNCNAPIDTDKHKCEYCGTPYFDMSFIDFEDEEPFFLKFKRGNMYFTQLVRPHIGEVSFTSETIDVIGRYGERVGRISRSTMLTTSIEFEGIPMKNGALITVEKE